jgi:hypothetical protein
MARHRIGSLELITEGRRADQGHPNVPREFATHCYLRPFDPIDPGISSRTAAFDGYFETRHKSQIHEVLGDRGSQRQFSKDSALADLEVSQGAGMRMAPVLPSKYEVENHFQYHFYSIPFRAEGNDESHTRL